MKKFFNKNKRIIFLVIINIICCCELFPEALFVAKVDTKEKIIFVHFAKDVFKTNF